MTEHLTNLADLLTVAQDNHGYMEDEYPRIGPLAQDSNKRELFQAGADQAYTYQRQFKTHTTELLKLIAPKHIDPISDEEWQAMQDLFKEYNPARFSKKARTPSDD